MALMEVEKQRLSYQLETLEVKPHEVNWWFLELQKVLNGKFVRLLRIVAGGKAQRILAIANTLVEVVFFINDVGGWQNFKTLLRSIIKNGGIKETLEQLEGKCPCGKISKSTT